MNQQAITITNESIRASYDTVRGEFTLEEAPTGRAFVQAGSLPGVSGPARAVPTEDPVFGAGSAIDIGGASGRSGRIMLFPGIPFALIQSTLVNDTETEQIVNRVPSASFRVALDSPAGALKAFGTGGLSAPVDCPGSYEWLAIADPETRSGLVAGWLTQERASGILLPAETNGSVELKARCDFGRLQMEPGARASTEILGIGRFNDARLGLEAWADAIARRYHVALPAQPAGYCTWYSDKHKDASDHEHIVELAEFAAEHLAPYGFGFVQIDDGWQLGNPLGDGPRKNFTDYDPEGPYPHGMRPPAERISDLRLTPGLWLMPFAGTDGDPWFADKRSYFVTGEDGQPFVTRWGGASLDMTVPAAREYLRSTVHKIVHDWGYRYLKLDGLYTGIGVKQLYVTNAYREDDFGDSRRANPALTGVEAFRSGLRLIREAAGNGVFLLGCCVAQNMRSYGASFGLLDAMRIGQDNGGTWERWSQVSPVAGSRSYFLNGRVWFNDPDPLFVRAGLTLEEARTSAAWPSITGQLLSLSDWLPDLPDERIEVLRRILPSHGRTARPADLFENDPPCVWTVTDDTGSVRRDVVALFNWTDEARTFDIPVARLDLPAADRFAAFEFWSDHFEAPFETRLTATVPAHACRILAVRPLTDRPFVLSTSRHVTQGMTDLSEEEWTADAEALRGSSLIVASDPYELRIVAPSEPRRRRVIEVCTAEADRDAGVTASIDQKGEEVRAVITSPTSRSVRWVVRFELVPPTA